MPTFKVTDPETGLTLKLTGDSPPTEQELIEIFDTVSQRQNGGQSQPVTSQAPVVPQSVPTPQQPQEEPSLLTNIGRNLGGAVETGLNIGSSAVDEAVAGIAGLAKTITSGPEAGSEIIDKFRGTFLFTPKSERGKEILSSTAEVLKPIGESLQFTKSLLGDSVFEATGSPSLATGAAVLPDVILESLGLKGSRITKKVGPDPKNRSIKKAIKESAPKIDDIKPVATAVFKEIDDLGATIKPGAYDDLVKRINASAKGVGFNRKINDKFSILLDEMNAKVGGNVSLSELDEFRKLAQGFASNIDRQTKALGVSVIDNIDTFLTNNPAGALELPAGAKVNIGNRLKVARQLWGSVRKGEIVQEIFENAKDAPNFERSVRDQFKQLLKNTKRSKFFSNADKEALRRVTRPGKTQRYLELMGKFGIDKDAALIGLLGGSVGGVLSGAGTGFAIPAFGTAARVMAKKMLRGNAEFAEAFIRAGNNAERITRAYLKFVPKGRRTVEELSTLLLRPDIDISKIRGTSFLNNARTLVLNKRNALIAATATAELEKNKPQQEQRGSDQGSIKQREQFREISREDEESLAKKLGF